MLLGLPPVVRSTRYCQNFSVTQKLVTTIATILSITHSRTIMTTTMTMSRMPANAIGRRHDCYRCDNDSSYIERMHKCSAAQWEKRLEY